MATPLRRRHEIPDIPEREIDKFLRDIMDIQKRGHAAVSSLFPEGPHHRKVRNLANRRGLTFDASRTGIGRGYQLTDAGKKRLEQLEAERGKK